MKKTIIGFILGAVMFGTVGVFAGQYMVTPNPFPIKIDGEDVEIEGYNINDNTYFKLRDIASVVGDFDVDFKDGTILLSKQETEAPDLSKQKEIFTSYYENELAEKYGMADLKKTHSLGLITNYIDDYDNDGNYEMAVVLIKVSDKEQFLGLRSCFLQMYEVKNGTVTMTEDRYIHTNIPLYFVKNVFFMHEYNGKKYICSTLCSAGVQGNLYTEHHLFSYDGSNLNRVLYLDDPGYTDGTSIYCTYNEDETSRRDAYTEMLNSNIEFENEYDLYKAVITKEGEPYGLKVTTYGDWRNYDFNDVAIEKSLPMYTSDSAKIIVGISYNAQWDNDALINKDDYSITIGGIDDRY